jgi:hypothetical protein
MSRGKIEECLKNATFFDMFLFYIMLFFMVLMVASPGGRVTLFVAGCLCGYAWLLKDAPASESDKLKLISSAENDEQKQEVAKLLSKSRVTRNDARSLCAKFSNENAETKISNFVNEHQDSNVSASERKG